MEFFCENSQWPSADNYFTTKLHLRCLPWFWIRLSVRRDAVILEHKILRSMFYDFFSSSRSQMFSKIGVLKNFANFTGKHMRWSVSLTLSLPVPRWAGANTDIPSNSNISKAVRVNIAFTATFFKEYSISFLMIYRLTDFSLFIDF